jgi:hypothetical protein
MSRSEQTLRFIAPIRVLFLIDVVVEALHTQYQPSLPTRLPIREHNILLPETTPQRIGDWYLLQAPRAVRQRIFCLRSAIEAVSLRPRRSPTTPGSPFSSSSPLPTKGTCSLRLPFLRGWTECLCTSDPKPAARQRSAPCGSCDTCSFLALPFQVPSTTVAESLFSPLASLRPKAEETKAVHQKSGRRAGAHFTFIKRHNTCCPRVGCSTCPGLQDAPRFVFSQVKLPAAPATKKALRRYKRCPFLLRSWTPNVNSHFALPSHDQLMAGPGNNPVQVFATGLPLHWEFLRLWTSFELPSSCLTLPAYASNRNRNILDFMR